VKNIGLHEKSNVVFGKKFLGKSERITSLLKKTGLTSSESVKHPF
jgi:hypothetical protein